MLRGSVPTAAGQLGTGGSDLANEARSRWNTEDPCPAVEWLLEQMGGDVDGAIRRLVCPPCSWESARQMSIALSHCFGMSEAEFMRRFKKLRGLKG